MRFARWIGAVVHRALLGYDFVSLQIGLKAGRAGVEVISMGDRRRARSGRRSRLRGAEGAERREEPAAPLLAAPTIRRDAVARGRSRLRAKRSCPAEEVASTLVDCLVGGRIP